MQKNAGYSLIELMTVIAILAILAAFAVPGLIGWRHNAELRRAAQDVYSILQKAKIEAARRNVTCVITFAANDFTTYVDSNGNFTLDGGELVINSTNWSQYPGVSLDTAEGGGDGLTFALPADGVAFAPNGFPMDNTGALASGTVFIKNQNNNKSSIVVSPAGNVRID
jgi:type IV fimbrial biogenesis protein FimT